MKASKDFYKVRMKVRHASFKGSFFAHATHGFRNILTSMLEHLLNFCGLNASVGDKCLERDASDFATNRVKRGEGDGTGLFINEHINARGVFEGANVAPLTADDFTFDILRRRARRSDSFRCSSSLTIRAYASSRESPATSASFVSSDPARASSAALIAFISSILARTFSVSDERLFCRSSRSSSLRIRCSSRFS